MAVIVPVFRTFRSFAKRKRVASETLNDPVVHPNLNIPIRTLVVLLDRRQNTMVRLATTSSQDNSWVPFRGSARSTRCFEDGFMPEKGITMAHATAHVRDNMEALFNQRFD